MLGTDAVRCNSDWPASTASRYLATGREDLTIGAVSKTLPHAKRRSFTSKGAGQACTRSFASTPLQRPRTRLSHADASSGPADLGVRPCLTCLRTFLKCSALRAVVTSMAATYSSLSTRWRLRTSHGSL